MHGRSYRIAELLSILSPVPATLPIKDYQPIVSELGTTRVPFAVSSDTVPPIVLGKERGSDDLPKMSEPECRAHRELDDLRPQNDHTAIGTVGLYECELSAPVAERLP